jgi:hypothetical protein
MVSSMYYPLKYAISTKDMHTLFILRLSILFSNCFSSSFTLEDKYRVRLQIIKDSFNNDQLYRGDQIYWCIRPRYLRNVLYNVVSIIPHNVWESNSQL